MIDGVSVTPLKVLGDERGAVLRWMRPDTPSFKDFGEAYFSKVAVGAVKAWKRHNRMTMNLTVPMGRVRFVLYDDRPDSPTKGEVQVVEIGADNHSLLSVEPGIWNGFTAVGDVPALIANMADMVHDPEEFDRLEADSSEIPYDWSQKN